MIVPLTLVAALIAAPTSGKPGDQAAQAEAAAVEKAADSAASAADSANKAATAAEKAAEAAQKAAEAAQKAAESAAQAVAKPAPPPGPPIQGSPPAQPPPPPPPDVVWAGNINIGMIAITGNANSIAFNAAAAFQRKGPEWIIGFKGSATYGQSKVNGTPATATAPATPDVEQTSAEAATVQLRGDRRFTDSVSGYLLGGVDTDHLASIEERPYGELGASLQWWELKIAGEDKKDDYVKSSLRTDLGFRYGREYRFQYFPVAAQIGEVDIVAPHLGVGFRYAVNKEVWFTNDLDLTANVEGDARLLLVNTAKLGARLTKTTAFTVSFLINYDSLPPAPKVTTDTALTVGVEIAL